MESIFDLPEDESVAKFMQLRSEYLKNKQEQATRDQQDAIKLASKIQKHLQEIRGFKTAPWLACWSLSGIPTRSTTISQTFFR